MKKKNTNHEKRQYIRLDANFMLHHAPYSLDENQDDKAVKGALKNYSSEGVLFESKVQYNLGDLLKLEIAIPDWDRFKGQFYADDRITNSETVLVLALVTRVECLKHDQLFEIGACFAGIDKGDHFSLIKQINEKLKKQ